MKLAEIIVKNLTDEHRDREWVSLDGGWWTDVEGWHTYQIEPGQPFLWLEDRWVTTDFCGGWRSITPQPEYGPYMEALHYRVTRGR